MRQGEVEAMTSIKISELPENCFRCDKNWTVLMQWPKAKKMVYCDLHAIEAIALWFARDKAIPQTIRMTRFEKEKP